MTRQKLIVPMISFYTTDVARLVTINVTRISFSTLLLIPHTASQYCSDQPLSMVLVINHNYTNSTYYLTSNKFLLLQNFTAGAVHSYILMDNYSSEVYSRGEFSMPADNSQTDGKELYYLNYIKF